MISCSRFKLKIFKGRGNVLLFSPTEFELGQSLGGAYVDQASVH